MKKTLLTLSLSITSLMGFSQHVYHDAEDVCSVLSTQSIEGTYVSSVANPDASGINTSNNVSSILASANNDELVFNLSTPLLSGDTFKIQYYSVRSGTSTKRVGRYRIRMYNSTLGTGVRLDLATENRVASAWTEFSATITDEGGVDDAGGYDRLIIIPTNNGDGSLETFYFDNIEADRAPLTIADNATLDAGHEWVYNNTTSDLTATLSSFGAAVTFTPSVTSPTTNGNTSANVLEIVRGNDANNTGVLFVLPSDIDYTAGNLKFRVFPTCNANVTDTNVRIRLRKDGDTGTQINFSKITVTQNQWNEVTLDLDSEAAGTALNGLYNEVVLLLDQGDSSSAPNGHIFYVDAMQVPEASTLSTDDVTVVSETISAYPNPVTNSFKVNSTENIESVALYNISGSLVKTFNGETNYDISDLATGVYMAKINTASGSKTLKIVKK